MLQVTRSMCRLPKIPLQSQFFALLSLGDRFPQPGGGVYFRGLARYFTASESECLSRSLISQHLAILRKSCMMSNARERQMRWMIGRGRICCLSQPLGPLQDFLDYADLFVLLSDRGSL